MTTQRDGTGTATFTPPPLGAAVDVLGLAQPADRLDNAAPRSLPRRVVYKYAPGLYYWSLVPYDFRSGYNKIQRGNYDEVHDFLVDGDLDVEFEQHGFAPLLGTEITSLDPVTGDRWAIYFANAFGVLVMATMNVTGALSADLVVESVDGSLTEPTQPATVAASEGLVGITPINIGGTAYLALQKIHDPVELLDSVTAAAANSVGSMHSSTTACYGMIQVALPTVDVVYRAQGSDGATYSTYTLGPDATVSTAGEEQDTKQPAGGYPIGFSGLAGGKAYCYWNFPPKDTPWGLALVPGGLGTTDANAESYRGHIWQSNEMGQDMQDITHRFGLTNAPLSVLVRNGIAASDHEIVSWHNGRITKTLSPFENALPNSDLRRRITNLAVKDEQDLYIEVNEIAAPGVTRNTVRYLLKYIWARDAWVVKSKRLEVAAQGLQSFNGSRGGMPVSEATGYCYNRIRAGSNGSWWRQRLVKAGINPYTTRKTSDATAATGEEFEPTSSATGPTFTIPELPPGGQYLVAKLWGPPSQQIRDGGDGAQVTVGLGGMSATFTARERAGSFPSKDLMPHSNWVNELQWSFAATQQSGGTDPTRKVINVLPVAAEGWYRVPSEMGKQSGMQLPEDWRV